MYSLAMYGLAYNHAVDVASGVETDHCFCHVWGNVWGVDTRTWK